MWGHSSKHFVVQKHPIYCGVHTASDILWGPHNIRYTLGSTQHPIYWGVHTASDIMWGPHSIRYTVGSTQHPIYWGVHTASDILWGPHSIRYTLGSTQHPIYCGVHTASDILWVHTTSGILSDTHSICHTIQLRSTRFIKYLKVYLQEKC
jgi:hypothetical protein